ncbi:hypothetical protein GGE66_000928 [Rhizobium leguminosarum]|uniref:Uncharacterized protein n=1 Tax=Rhizobium leguminosarum TaxID=384 RepID=A0A7W9ZR48_RHILE|nr:hypothetical protein [Rhizobium leguminosarum]
MTVPSGLVMLAVEKLSTLPDPADEPAEADEEEEPAEPLPVVVDEDTCPLPAVTVVDISPAWDWTIVHVVPSSSLISSDIVCPAIKTRQVLSAIVESWVIVLISKGLADATKAPADSVSSPWCRRHPS